MCETLVKCLKGWAARPLCAHILLVLMLNSSSVSYTKWYHMCYWMFRESCDHVHKYLVWKADSLWRMTHYYCYPLQQEVILFLLKCPPYWVLLIAGSIRNIPGYALGSWLPTFFKRQYGVDSNHFAIPVGLVVLFGGGAGSFVGGFLSDRWGWDTYLYKIHACVFIAYMHTY